MSHLLCRFLEFWVWAKSVTSGCAKPEKSSHAQAHFNVLGSEVGVGRTPYTLNPKPVILNPP